MNYIIYKTTNLVNNKYYVGCHQTANLNDGYIGSGKHLRHAVKKYGIDNFKVEILHHASTKEEMFQIEKHIVNEELVNDVQSYNLKIGGSGGNPGIVGAFTGKTHSVETKEKQRQASLGQVTTNAKREKLSRNNGMKDATVAKKVADKLTGRTLTSEHRKNVALANTGKIIVNANGIAKRIPKEELQHYVNNGWKKGGLPRPRNKISL